MHHPVHDHGIDHAAQIVHGEIAEHLHLPGVAEHFHHADVRPEREDEVPRIEEADRLQPRLQVLRHVVREVRHERDVAEGFEAPRRSLHRELPVFVDDVGLVGLEQVGGDLLRLLLDLLRAHVEGRRPHRGAAAPVASHPERHLARIAVHDLDVLDGKLQLVRGDLRERGLVALTVAVRSGEHGHLPRGVHPHCGALVQASLGSQRADDLRGSQSARLHIGGEPDPEITAALARLLLLLAECRVIEGLQRLVERAGIVPAVVEEGDGCLVRELLLGNEVLAADLQRIHSQLGRGQVHHPLQQIGGFRAPRAAIRVHRRRVREHRGHVDVDGGCLVRAGEQRAVQVGRDAGREQREISAHVRHRLHPQPENAAVLRKRHLRVAVVIAAVRICEEGFTSLRGPLHRPRERPRRPGDHALLGIDEDLRAEAAADVGRDHAQFVLWQPEHEGRHDQPVHVRVLRRHPERDLAGDRIGASQGRTGLDGVRNEAMVAEALLHHSRGARERLVGGCLVAELPAEADVVRGFVVDRRSAPLERLGRIRHRRQRLVIDLHELGRIARDVGRLRDHHGDRVAHVAGAIDGQRVVSRDLHVRDQPARRDGLHPARNQVLSRVRRDDGLEVFRRLEVDADDARVRVRAADECGIGGAGNADVIDVRALAGDEARVLAALDARSEE